MRLLVVGAAGRTGTLLLQLAIEGGHTVTALARDPRRLAPVPGIHRVITGDATDSKIIFDAVPGQDAVITTVAAPDRGPNTVVSSITRTLVDAMERAQVRRLVVTSSRNITATRPWIAVAPTKRVFRHVYADLARAEQVVMVSHLDWTIARGARLTDDPGRGAVHIDQSANATGGDWKLPRADYARALLDTVQNPETIRCAIGVNGVRR